MHTDRRTFLQSTAALAGAAIAPRFAWADPVEQSKKIRIGIVGGGFGTAFYFHEHPNCIVHAVSDLRPERRERLMQTYRCEKSYESLEVLITDDQIDAVAIFTPGPDHVRHVELCLKAGKHVLCAVPAAWGTLEECHRLHEAVKTSGRTYMMAETSFYQQPTISARKMYQAGEMGNVFYTESEYHHPGLEELYWENGKRTWRYGVAPMHYPTHCTAHLISVTGERLTDVSCIGWGDDSPILKDNPSKNPFWSENAFFKTDRGNAFRVGIWWRGAARGCERAQLFGDKASFFWPHPNGVGTCIVRDSAIAEKDAGGFVRHQTQLEPYDQPQWWNTELLPEPLRHDSGHEGSHTFLTHEFIDALVNKRQPAVNINEALAYTAPGIVAHESALKGGESMKIPAFAEI